MRRREVQTGLGDWDKLAQGGRVRQWGGKRRECVSHKEILALPNLWERKQSGPKKEEKVKAKAGPVRHADWGLSNPIKELVHKRAEKGLFKTK